VIDDERGWVGSRGCQGLLETATECAAVRLRAGHVDRKVHANPHCSGGLPLGELFTSLQDHPIIDSADDAGLFSKRDELRGVDEAAQWMRPPDQGLKASEFMGAKVHDGLVVELEMALLDRADEMTAGHVDAEVL
jgi:hypothetical protein